MGVIHRGWHVLLERPIAIKVLRASYANDREAILRFMQEARTGARLYGPHVARVLDVGCLRNGLPFMVMELLEGSDLHEVLYTAGPLPLGDAQRLALEACEGLAMAHAEGVVHRDLKPANLFVTQERNRATLKILDFGVSKLTDAKHALTLEGQNLGSPHYMAPEQMLAPAEVDGRADIWSLGVVLYELLTGQVPFDGPTFRSTCVAVRDAEPAAPSTLRPDLPTSWDRVILRCLEKVPANRFATIEGLRQALAVLPLSHA